MKMAFDDKGFNQEGVEVSRANLGKETVLIINRTIYRYVGNGSFLVPLREKETCKWRPIK